MQKNGDDEEEEDEEDEQDEVDDDDECELLQVYWEAKTPKKWRTLIRTDTDVQLKVCQLWADALYVFFERTEVSCLLHPELLFDDLYLLGPACKHQKGCRSSPAANEENQQGNLDA